MSKILLNLCLSLDGFIEGPNGEYDWCLTDQDYGMTAFLARCDSIVFGRKSYEIMLQHDENAFADKMKYVFSNSVRSVAGKAAVVSGDIQEAVDKIKQRNQGDIWFFGGASLFEAFLKLELIDEMHLAVHPLLLGSGKPLFPKMETRKAFKLIGVEQYSSGLVQLIYGK
jgi:dihydrofolate reductase